MIHERYVYESLHRNGIIIERARRAGRSLTHTERNIIAAGRNLAAAKQITRAQMNAMEMDGERNHDEVMRPISVDAVFAYYSDPFGEFPATASYFIRVSNHPALPPHGNVCEEQLTEAGVKVPKTPTYQAWVKAGRKATRE